MILSKIVYLYDLKALSKSYMMIKKRIKLKFI